MKRKLFAGAVAFATALILAESAAATPILQVTADHLGGGLIQYTINLNNDLGGDSAVQISASGNINQVPSLSFPGGVSLQSDADVAQMFDPGYISLGGKAADSWWNDIAYVSAGPFAGGLGGAVGSTLFQFSGATSGVGAAPNLQFLGQIVIYDAAAAVLPLGPTPVVSSGAALLSIIDPNPLYVDLDSVVAAQGQTFSITGTFAVLVPEPSAIFLLLVTGLAAFAVRRHKLR